VENNLKKLLTKVEARDMISELPLRAATT